MARPRSSLLLALALAALACGERPAQDAKAAGASAAEAKQADAEAEAKQAEAEPEAKPEAEPSGVVALESLGLEAPLEGGAQVNEMMGSLVVQAGELTVTVERGEGKPETGEAAQAAAADRSPVDPKLEALADGYALTFTNTGSLGTNYWVEVRRELAGKPVWCTTTASAQAQADAALAFCKGLRPAAG